MAPGQKQQSPALAVQGRQIRHWGRWAAKTWGALSGFCQDVWMICGVTIPLHVGCGRRALQNHHAAFACLFHPWPFYWRMKGVVTRRRPRGGDLMMSFAGWRVSVAVATVALTVSACTGSRVGALNTQPAPAPLPAAPSGTVSTGQPLPPPSQPTVAQNQFPDAPAPTTPVVDTPVVTQTDTGADTGSSGVQEVASAKPVTREALVGAWTVSTAGSSCQMFMALTQWTGGYRAASRGCPGDAASVAAWDVQGQQVVLSDSSGNRVATLFSSGGNRFDGQTKSGRAISLSR